MFPDLYHTHHSRHNEDLPFWSALARQKPGPLLELGCGTGRILFELAKTGKTVVGIDLDFGMLRFLHRDNAERLPANLFVLQADFTAFHLAGSFGLSILGCNTYSTQAAPQRQKLLACVKQHLQPDGVFAISVPNPQVLTKLPRHAQAEVEEIFPHPVDGEPVQVSSEWRRDRQVLAIDWHYDHLLPDGLIERTDIHVDQYLISYEQIQAEFLFAGFQNLLIYGDYDQTKYLPISPYLILVASG